LPQLWLGFLGQAVDAAIIGVMVLVGIAVNFFQTYRSHWLEKDAPVHRVWSI